MLQSGNTHDPESYRVKNAGRGEVLSCRAACLIQAVQEGPSANDSVGSRCRSRGVFRRTGLIVSRAVVVRNPFGNVSSHVKQSVRTDAGWITSNDIWPEDPDTGGVAIVQSVAVPGISPRIDAGGACRGNPSSGLLPLGFGRKAPGAGIGHGHPVAKMRCIVPGDIGHRIVPPIRGNRISVTAG